MNTDAGATKMTTDTTIKTQRAVPGDLFRHYGMPERPICVGAFLEISNEDVRVIAELLGKESREAADADCPEVASALDILADRLLRKAAEMDAEAAE
jgi:hypothetical protein